MPMKVYHLQSNDRDIRSDVQFSLDLGLIKKIFDKQFEPTASYVLAAVVSAVDLDDVFRLTNSVDTHWSANTEILKVGKSQRSSSVGDIFVKSDGRAYVVNRCGFVELKSEEEENEEDRMARS